VTSLLKANQESPNARCHRLISMAKKAVWVEEGQKDAARAVWGNGEVSQFNKIKKIFL